MGRALSTTGLAKKLKFSQAYLQKLIARKLVPAPPLVEVAGFKVRLWAAKDIAKLKAALKKRPRTDWEKPKRRTGKGASR